MLGKLNVVSWSLAVGVMGLQWFYRRAFGGIPTVLVLLVLALPWLTVYTITFVRRPPFGPRAFRFCLLMAICTYLLFVIGAEIIQQLYRLPADGGFSLALARILMYFGCLSFIPLAHAYLTIQRAE